MYKLSLSPFWLIVFVVLAQSVGAMTIKCSCVLAGHGRPITSESSVTPLFIQQPYARDSAFAIVYGCFSRIKKMLGRTEMRTRDKMYCQTIRSVWDISRGDRARIATCSLRTSPDRQTDRLKANYSIDYVTLYHLATCSACTVLKYNAAQIYRLLVNLNLLSIFYFF